MTWILVRPRFDQATEHSYRWAEQLKEWLGGDCIDLGDNDAVRLKVEQALVTNPGASLAFYDHGNEISLIGQDRQPVISLPNAHLLAKREVYTLACLSAKDLGIEVWRKGGKFWGYDKEFTFTTDALEEFGEAANCGFKFRHLDKLQPKQALDAAKGRMTSLMQLLADTNRPFSAIWMRHNRDCTKYYDGEEPQSECVFRSILLKLLGKRGWKIQSPTRVIRRLCSSWQDFYRVLAHIPVGLLNVAFLWVNPMLGLVFGAGFLVYEVTQGKEPHKDIRGWAWGVGIGGAVWLITVIVSGL